MKFEEGKLHSPADRSGGGENNETDLEQKIHDVLFSLEHNLSQSYQERVQMLEEGGYNMAITTPNERLSSVLIQEVEERQGVLQELSEEVSSVLPQIQDAQHAESKGKIEAYQTQVAAEIAQLDTLLKIANEVWQARGGFAELAASIAKDPAAQKVIKHLGVGEEAASITQSASQEAPIDFESLRNRLEKRLADIEAPEKPPSAFVREVSQTLRAYVGEMGRPAGSS